MKLKKVNVLIILLMLLSLSLNAQRRGRWYQIDNNDIKTTFMDSTTVKVNDNQISVWILEIFEQPFTIPESTSPAKRSRTQYLFNTPDNSYSIIGNLYYDEIGKIISQNYNPIIGGGTRTIYEPVSSNEDVKTIYKNVAEFLGLKVNQDQDTTAALVSNGNSIAERIENLNKEMEVDSTGINDADSLIDYGEPITNISGTTDGSISPNESEMGPDSDPLDLPYKTNEIPDGAKVAQIYNPVTSDYFELVSVKAEEPELVVEEKIEETPTEYNLAAEKNVTNTIFTDGSLFCFQVSSWKDENIAKREVNKLKAKDHNAYYVEANLGRRGNWYRVRIGYFNTREEAREYQRNLK